MRKMLRELLSTIIINSLIVMIVGGTPMWAQGSVSYNELSKRYLNATEKYLHLGREEANTYKFSIKKSMQEKGDAYLWYVKEDKGNSGTVTINSRTGVVTAKAVGTAYIRCRITKTDGTILRPEAKVVVRNNISEVSISNLPKSNTITAGKAYDFDRRVVTTEAGKGVRASGITRWEIAEDNAKVVKATDKGIVFPTKEGEFKIRAVSFQSKTRYNLWLKNKTVYANYITAASEWSTISVTSSKGSATVETQEQLTKSLKADSINHILISTNKTVEFNIPKGDYSNKTLVVDAPNADVNNYGVFQQITINAIKDNTWIEFADGNILYLKDDVVSFVIEKDVRVKRIVIDREDSKVNFEIKGSVEQITILKPAEVNITGSGTKVPIVVEETAGNSNITSSIPLELTLKSDTEVNLNQGAEGTALDKKESRVKVTIENKTKANVVLTTNKTGEEIIEAGKSAVSDATTAPFHTPVLPGPTFPTLSPTPSPTPIPDEDQAAPTGLAGIAPTTFGGTDGKITGVTQEMEYKRKAVGDNEWETVDGTEITGLIDGTYVVRYKAKADYKAGTVAEVIIPEGPKTISEQFPDTNLASAIAEWLEYGVNDIITKDIIEAYISAGNVELYLYSKNISNLIGFEIFHGTDIELIRLNQNNLTSLTLNDMPKLLQLSLSGNELSSVGLNGLPKLEQLDLINNHFIELDVNHLTSLKFLWVDENQLTELNVSNLKKLTDLGLSGNQFESFDASNLSNLNRIVVCDNPITHLNVRNLTELDTIFARNTSLPSLDVTGLTGLQFFYAAPLTINEIIGSEGLNRPFHLGCTDIAELQLSPNQAAPTGLQDTAPTTTNGTDGKITGVTEAMEYKLSTAEVWISVVGTEITGLPVGTYQVRLKAKPGFYAGAVAEIIVPTHLHL